MNDEQLKWVTKQTGRSNGQTQFLYNLVGCDFNELLRLETQIKRSFTYSCPSNMDEVEEVYNKKEVSTTFKFEEYGV